VADVVYADNRWHFNAPWWSRLIRPRYVIVRMPLPRGGEERRDRARLLVLPWRWLAETVYFLTRPRATWASGWVVEMRRISEAPRG
jgi:hypothetical protein